MNGLDQLYRWNAWFDAQTPRDRFDLAVWAVVILGLLNLLLTLALGMAFGLLLLLGLILANVARLPYALGELPPPATAAHLAGAERLQAWHRRITAAPDHVVSLPILGVALAAILGMGSLAALSTKAGPGFGILFILAVVNALVVIRGHVPAKLPPEAVPVPPQPLAIGQDRQQSSLA
ncbi:MAG: hypothetical protein EON48_07925 [Acetobacteraceae bacterium]|nr:MAG: hypothetical protein EON48_07925 [Acetobacteraceae bacterium]